MLTSTPVNGEDSYIQKKINISNHKKVDRATPVHSNRYWTKIVRKDDSGDTSS
jgi:hypothetical protein